MNLSARTEMFVCSRLHSTIRRDACAARHRLFAAKDNRSQGTGSALGVTSCACRTCPIGQQHARGREPDVLVIAVVAKASAQSTRVRRCSGCAEPLPVAQTRRGRALSTCSDACAELHAQFIRASQESQLPEWG